MIAAALGRVAGALLAMWLLPNPARLDEEPPADPAPECKPLVEILGMMSVDARPMPAEAIGPMLVFHNASPPPSDDAYEAAAYATTKQGVGVVLWLRGADVCQRDLIPPPAWSRLLPLIEGRAT